jgi:Kef-type K+ transport system membrane component KefB
MLLVLFEPAAATGSAVSSDAESLVLRLLVQLVLILVATRLVVWLVHRMGQTDVSGEILTGILLGPSLLGALAPETMAAIFHPSTSPVFVGLAQLGLIMLMFQIGLEFEFGAHISTRRRDLVLISGLGLVVPFAFGYLTAPFFYANLPEETLPPQFGFQLFFGIAMSITAIPILGRIFMELGLSHTRTAALTIGAAAIDDVVGWLLLGVISLVVVDEFSTLVFAGKLGLLSLYLVVVFMIVRPLLLRAVIRQLERHGVLPPAVIAGLLVVLFLSAIVTSLLGVFAIIGGFTIGLALHQHRPFVAQWKAQVSPLVTTLLLPVFFAYTGLRTDIGTLGDTRELGLCVLVCLVAFVSKFGGAYTAARVIGEPRRSALTIATCMNTRALMELVAINVGMDLGVLTPSMFTKLVIMALVSTFMATPLIRWLMKQERRPLTP